MTTPYALLAALPGCGSANKAGGPRAPDAVTLTLANFDSHTLDLDHFADEVEHRSQGSIHIRIENNWRSNSADHEQRTIEDVRAGRVDLAKVNARAFDLVGVETFQPLLAPFAIDSYALERRVLHSELAAPALKGVEAADVVGIALLPGELRRPIGVRRDLVTAEDYRGATVATRASDLGGRAFNALGAEPVYVLPRADVSTYDGAENSMLNIEGERSDGPARTVATNVVLWPRLITVVMNSATYDGLTTGQRQALRDAGVAAIDPGVDTYASYDKEATGILCNRGEIMFRRASAAELADLRAAVQPVTDGIDDQDAVRAITAMRGSVRGEPAPSCTAASTPSADGDTTPIDGMWRMTTTKAEFAKIAQPVDVVPENWGEFRLALAEGRFAITTENGPACIWAYGTYEVKGDIVDWTFTDGGGHSVTQADFFNRPGEFFRYRWNRYRDRLELGPVKAAISAEPFRVKPYSLISDTAQRGDLSPNCLPPRDALQP